jgi:hypothetical protein
MQKKLINFRAPIELQTAFDLVCKYKSQSRTKILLELMHEYVSIHHQPITEQIKSLRDLNKNLSETVIKSSGQRTHGYQRETEFDVPIWDNNQSNYF